MICALTFYRMMLTKEFFELLLETIMSPPFQFETKSKTLMFLTLTKLSVA